MGTSSCAPAASPSREIGECPRRINPNTCYATSDALTYARDAVTIPKSVTLSQSRINQTITYSIAVLPASVFGFYVKILP